MSYIDEYISNLDKPNKDILQDITYLVRELVPGCKEVKSYGIPTFKYKDKNLIHFAAYENHLSIYPGSHAIEVFSKDLVGFTISKGTIQFTADKPINPELIKKIIQLRKQDIDEGQ